MTQRNIERKCKEANEKWMNGDCMEIENLQDKHNYFYMYN